MCLQKRVDKPFLPIDIVVFNILSRLPAKDILRFRSVCKSWKEMTSTKQFLQMQLRQVFPLILVLDIQNRYCMGTLLLNKWWEKPHVKSKIIKIARHPDPTNVWEFETKGSFSQDGLIVLKESVNHQASPFRNFIIFNPTFSEQVKIRVPETIINSDMYAVFFHPVLNEYCTIWRVTNSDPSTVNRVTYTMLVLGPDPCWKELINPCDDEKSMFKDTSPVYSNGCIYWLVTEKCPFFKSIMMLDIETETFSTINLPPEVDLFTFLFRPYMRILEIDGLLALVYLHEASNVGMIEIHIWKLEDNKKPSWTYATSHAIGEGVTLCRAEKYIPIAVVDGILAFHNTTRIFVCNLKLGKVTKYGRKKYYSDVLFWSHITSIVSLRNCKAVINIKEFIYSAETSEEEVQSKLRVI